MDEKDRYLKKRRQTTPISRTANAIGKRRVKETIEPAQLKQKCCCKPLEPAAFMIFEYCPKYDLFTYVAEGFTVGNEILCHALFY
jgi:hypothetical protein